MAAGAVRSASKNFLRACAQHPTRVRDVARLRPVPALVGDVVDQRLVGACQLENAMGDLDVLVIFAADLAWVAGSVLVLALR